MSLDTLTLSQIKNLGSISPKLSLIGRRLLASTYGYDEFVDVLEIDILECIKILEQDPGVRRKDGEDRLTAELISMLISRSYNASHDKKIGGHADIVVEDQIGYLWIGEAKIHKTYDWILKGFNQLCTRYSRGTPDSDRGALIVFSRNKDVSSVISKWQKKLESTKPENYTNAPCLVRGPLGFRSTHKHESSGLPYKVWHVGVVLHFDPKA